MTKTLLDLNLLNYPNLRNYVYSYMEREGASEKPGCIPLFVYFFKKTILENGLDPDEIFEWPKEISDEKKKVVQVIIDKTGLGTDFAFTEAEKEKLDDYFLVGVTRINELLCQREQRLISVNNSNLILTSLITYKYSIPTTLYPVLWKNLVLQAHHGKDEWIMSYWETASQRQQMRKYSGDNSIDAIERREAQEERMQNDK